MKYILLSTLCFLAVTNNFAQKKRFTGTDFGARPESKTNNSKAIQSCIDAASKTANAKVIVPPGYFLTGPLRLKSGVELHLEEGAVLLGSTHRMDYGDTNALPLIGAKNVKDISITGNGIINGQGRELVKDLLQQLTQGILDDKEWKIKRPTEKNRPRLIVFEECTNITVKGITLKNGSGWIQDYVRCNNIIIDSIRVESTDYWNNDGIDIVNSKNVSITNCYVDVADDAICLKSEGKPGICENIYVANCTLRSSASAFKLGTGSSGGFKNIIVKNLYIYDTYRSAIALEAVDGGFIEDVDIQDVTAVNTGNALLIRLGHRNKDDRYSRIKKISISNIKVQVPAGKPDIGYPIEGPPLKYPHNVIPASITGIVGHPVEDVTLSNIEIIYEGGGKKEMAHFNLDTLESVPENIAGYPEFSMFGELPAWGLYVRHATGVQMNNIKLTIKNNDYRCAMILDDVKDVKLNRITIPKTDHYPVIILNKVTGYSQEKIKTPFSEKEGIRIQ